MARQQLQLAASIALTLIFALSSTPSSALAADAERTALRDEICAAVERSLALLERSATTYRAQRECFSCHHQAVPVLAVQRARTYGLQVDDQNLQEQLQHTYAHLQRGQKGYEQGRGQGGAADTAGYALWTLAAGNWTADEVTGAVAHYLLQRCKERGFWRTSSNRPPSEASHFTTTFLALQGLKCFAPPEQTEQVRERLDAAHQWLLYATPVDTEDHVFRLRALHALDRDPWIVQSAAAALLQRQRLDGGWGQTEDWPSDAYATGSALAALHDTHTCTADDPAYQAGMGYLMRTQLTDGSWHVQSRSDPFQTYFESGFPHAQDQFISAAATSWAVLALLGGLQQP